MYTRAAPSPRYRELLAAYRTMHEQGEVQSGLPPEKTFSGHSLYAHLPTLREMTRRLRARSLLDYGAGKGQLHRERPLKLPDGSSAESLNGYLGLERAVCYDPGNPPFMARPVGTFDLVVCCDVLEHCPAEDLPWILDDVVGHARLGLFLVVACYPARKSLPNGENAHVTVQPPAWWKPLVKAAVGRRGDLAYRVEFEVRRGKESMVTTLRGRTPPD